MQPPAVTCRLVVDNDWSGDPDGLVALAHHLLSPSNRVDAITSTFLDPAFASPRSSAADGAASAAELVSLLGLDVPVHAGADAAYVAGRPPSAAATVIVDHAARSDPLPLYVVSGAPLTNVAEALDLDPGLADRTVLIWVGGATGDAHEYNRDTDPAAAERVLASGLEVWQFPVETYTTVAFSLAELEHAMGGNGRVGAWLWRQYVELPLPGFLAPGPVWPLGDSPPVLVTALSGSTCRWTESVRASGARHRTCTALDSRLLIGDLLAKLGLHG